jgi:indole-3-acetate monooxygenase
VLGLRGTGSDVYALEDHFVPREHAVLALHRWPGEAHRAMAAPFRFGPSSLYGPGFGALALGNARGMLDAFVAFARRKTPLWNRNPISQSALVQVAVAEADARLESARVYLVQTMRELEAAAMRQGALDTDQRMTLRGASTFSIRVATAVVDSIYDMTGTTAVFDGEAMQRRFRDAHTISQHLQGRVSHLETVGRHILGVASDLRFA